MGNQSRNAHSAWGARGIADRRGFVRLFPCHALLLLGPSWDAHVIGRGWRAVGVDERGFSWRHRAVGRSSRGEPPAHHRPGAGRDVRRGGRLIAARLGGLGGLEGGGYQGRYARDGARRKASRNATSGEQGPVRRRCTLASVDGGKDGWLPWIGLGGEAGGSWR